MYVTLDQIRDRIAEMGEEDCLILESNGYSLHYAEPGWFWVATPPDREGKVYTFVWPDAVLHP